MIQMDFRWKFMSKEKCVNEKKESSYKDYKKKSIAESGGKGRIR